MASGAWKTEERGGVAIVTMRSGPVNKMNDAFFAELHAAMDAVDLLDAERARKNGAPVAPMPLILTAEGNTFSAGLDVEDAFARFERRDLLELEAWFESFKRVILRVFQSPRRTIAAINGNAFAGGLILALACDVRVGTQGKGKFALNEVHVGIAVPATFVELVGHAVGTVVVNEAILNGRIYNIEQALERGFVHSLAAPDRLLEEAIARAKEIPAEGLIAYAACKSILQASFAQRLAADLPRLDRMALEACIAPESIQAQANAWARLASKKP